MRRAKSYSIIDHQFLHQGYFQSLGLEALALYLFLVVVADRDGKSYYAERTVAEILRLSPEKYSVAISQLSGYGLVEFRRPFYWVKNLSPERG
jgi:replication initiation and membrane attachment protein DnaB